VLLLHGNSDHVHCWDWTVDHFPSDWSVVGFDFPGHGKSEMPDIFSPTHDLFGYCIRYVLDELGWENVHIISHSMGTFVAAPFTCIYPEIIESFTLLDFPGLQTIYPYTVPKYSAMSFDNRYDRWVRHRPGVTIQLTITPGNHW